jgi:hypothetical protein
VHVAGLPTTVFPEVLHRGNLLRGGPLDSEPPSLANRCPPDLLPAGRAKHHQALPLQSKPAQAANGDRLDLLNATNSYFANTASEIAHNHMTCDLFVFTQGLGTRTQQCKNLLRWLT